MGIERYTAWECVCVCVCVCRSVCVWREGGLMTEGGEDDDGDAYIFSVGEKSTFSPIQFAPCSHIQLPCVVWSAMGVRGLLPCRRGRLGTRSGWSRVRHPPGKGRTAARAGERRRPCPATPRRDRSVRAPRGARRRRERGRAAAWKGGAEWATGVSGAEGGQGEGERERCCGDKNAG